MKAGGPPEGLMIPYLLGELSEQDQTNFERACLADDQLFEDLLAVEAELTDDYVRGNLAGLRRAAFEKRLLNSPDGAKQFELAQLITQRGSSLPKASAGTVQTERRLKWWPSGWLSNPAEFVPVGAAILVIGIGLGLALWKKQPSQSSGSVAQAPQSQTAGQKPGQSHPPPVIAIFVITAGGERDAGLVNEIKVPAGTDRLRFRLDLTATQYTHYRASLKQIGGRESSSLVDVQALPSTAGKTLTLELPAADLPLGDSILTVTGARTSQAAPEVIDRYFVRRGQ